MPKTGDRIKHYEIEKLLGKGGMGEVYLAQDTKLDRKVAIKFLPPDLEADEQIQARFIREAKAAAALDHPFICKVYESGEADGKFYIVMEYVEGLNLRERMESKPLSLNESLRIALEIAEALEKAHKEGIIHRDLKPPNIMLTPQEHVKVMDFGLAKKFMPGGGDLEQTLTQASLTEKGTIAGTLAYMSPEQAKGKKLDGRSDIFSLGIIICEMFSHKHPFSKTTPIETLSAILRDPPPTPNVRPKTINPILRPILKKTMAKDPEDRYQNISELISDLRKALRETHGGTRLPLQGIPLYIASAALVAVIATGVFFLAKRPAATPKAQPEPISILIADFQNQTGDSVFDGALEQLLGIGLEGAPFISIYDRPKARNLASQMDPSADGRLDAKLAQLISTREGIDVVIDGTIEQTEDKYNIKVWAIDPTTAEKIIDVNRTIKTKAEVGKASDYLSSKLRSKLGDSKTKASKAFAGETFTASSLIAMNAFAKGQEILFSGKREEAIPYFLRAIDNDPNLGRAYVSLGTIYTNLQQHEKAEKYYQMAFVRIDQMSDREKHRTRGTYYIIKRNYPKAIEEFTALTEKYPADTVGYMNLALSYFYSRDMTKAAEVGRRAVELAPKDVSKRYNLVWYLMGAGDFETAEQEVHKVLELDPEYSEAYVCKALIEICNGQSHTATETYQQLESRGDYGVSQAASGLADLALYEGRLSDAIDILKKRISLDIEIDKDYIAADKYIALAQSYWLQGNKKLAAEAADNAIATSRKEDVLFSAAEIYVQAGENDKARNIASELSKKVQPAFRAYAKMIGGELSMERADFPGAIQLFQEAQSIVDSWIGRFLLGKAYLEAEYFSEADSEFEQCLKRRGEATSVFFNDLPTYRYLAPVYYYLGRAKEGLKSPAASDSYEAFLIIKEKGEEDWMVKDARLRFEVR